VKGKVGESMEAKSKATNRIANDIVAQAKKSAAGCEKNGKDDKAQVVTLRSETVHTIDDALRVGKVDREIWMVDRWVLNKWDCVAKMDVPGVVGDVLAATELWQVKIWLKRKPGEIRAIESLLADLKKRSPVVPKIKVLKRTKRQAPRQLEIDLMDPHLGMRSHRPASDQTWSIDECETMAMAAIRESLKRAETYAPFEKIIWPYGNDLMHIDTLWHQTTAGTPQPEAESYHHTYKRAVELSIAIIDELKQVAPVKIIQVPGNHDRQTAFTLGMVMWAKYHNDANVEVDCSAAPYKFHHFGKNLIGFEHGKSVKPIRLAALMANECREAWAVTCYREWHRGDQHRKGTGHPLTMEEQGVSVEHLPGLVPPNEWHKLKSFNWQKRGVTSYVWDRDCGPIARLLVSFDSYSGKLMGAKQ